jgi:hypothetical protein
MNDDDIPTMSYRTLVTGVILGFIVIAFIALCLLVLR